MKEIITLNTHEIKAMGTLISLSIEHQESAGLFKKAEAKIKEWEHRFSANAETSELMAIKHQAGLSPVKVNAELYQMIKHAHHVSLSSNQKMNVLIGPLVKLWKIGFEGANVPSQSNIDKALTRINPNDMVLNDETQEVYLKQPGMELDLGAIVKGYFADELQQLFTQNGVTKGIINLGGNVITINQNQDQNQTFGVGIRDPFHQSGRPIAKVDVTQQSVVTSGIYERFFKKGDRIYHHILDSQTGYPVENDIQSVTIISDRSIDGEIWSTICSFGHADQNIEMLNQVEGIEGVIIKRNNEIKCSSRIRQNVTIFK